MKRLLSTVVPLTLALILVSSLTFATETKKGAPAPKAALLDINTATEAQLKALPGVGEAYSQKIIAGRPYYKTYQLQSLNIIPAATYEKIKDKITASRPVK
jgi:DNA uptake protein ComE-like DNA-binding protein